MRRRDSSKFSPAFVALALAVGIAGCTSSDGESTVPADSVVEGDGETADTTEVAATSGDSEGPAAGDSAPAAELPVPEVVDADALTECERLGVACGVFDATDDQIELAVDSLETVAAAMQGAADAEEASRLGVAAAAGLDGIGPVYSDPDAFSAVSFSVGGGPIVSVLTDAAFLVEDIDPGPVDNPITPPTPVEPTGLRRLVRQPLTSAGAPLLERYEPTGGALQTRTALIVNMFDAADANALASIFQAEPEYGTVTVLGPDDVDAAAIATMSDFDAVSILAHGIGSCPAWADDRSECRSGVLFSEVEGGAEGLMAERAAMKGEAQATLPAPSLCNASGALHYCAWSTDQPFNPNGITYVGSCNSDFGFGAGGGGATVSWTGTAHRGIVERTAEAFWTVMVADGVEFDHARDLIESGGYANHGYVGSIRTDLNMFTTAAFTGRNLRARDTVDATFEGDPLAGQAAGFNGQVGDGENERFPIDGERLELTLDGVKTGSESGVTFEIRIDGEPVESDIELARDGTIIEQGEGFADWRVAVPTNAVSLPPMDLADLGISQTPRDVEVRAYQDAAEFTATLGSLRFGTELTARGPIPIFEELATGALAVGGELVGNELVVTFNSNGGDVTGDFRADLSGQGISLGFWEFSMTGTYDPTSGSIDGDGVGVGQSTLPGFTSIGDVGTGPVEGTVNLEAGTVELTLLGGDPVQTYVGVIDVA